MNKLFDVAFASRGSKSKTVFLLHIRLKLGTRQPAKQTVADFASCLTRSAWSGGCGGKKGKTHYQVLMGGKYSYAFIEYLTQQASYKKRNQQHTKKKPTLTYQNTNTCIEIGISSQTPESTCAH